MDRMFVTYIKG